MPRNKDGTAIIGAGFMLATVAMFCAVDEMRDDGSSLTLRSQAATNGVSLLYVRYNTTNTQALIYTKSTAPEIFFAASFDEKGIAQLNPVATRSIDQAARLYGVDGPEMLWTAGSGSASRLLGIAEARRQR